MLGKNAAKNGDTPVYLTVLKTPNVTASGVLLGPLLWMGCLSILAYSLAFRPAILPVPNYTSRWREVL